MSEQGEQSYENLRTEYQEIGSNIRSVSDLKWREISMLMIVNGALFAAVQAIEYAVVIACLGIGFTSIITISHIRNKLYWDILTKRARAIEGEIGMKQFSKLKEEFGRTWVRRNVKVSNAIYFFDVIVILGWVYVLLQCLGVLT